MAVPETVCTPRAVGISVDVNVYEPHLLAGTMAHMIGHNIGMGHDDGRKNYLINISLLPTKQNLIFFHLLSRHFRLILPLLPFLPFLPLIPFIPFFAVGEECFCRDWHGCIMAQSIVGQENVQPYKFSECSKKDYIDALRTGHGLCLLNKPNEVRIQRKMVQLATRWEL